MDVLAELEAVGVLGNPEPKPVQVEERKLEVIAPAALLDIRGPRMAELCERAVGAVVKLEEEIRELRQLFEGMTEVWTGKKRIAASADRVPRSEASGTIEAEESSESDDGLEEDANEGEDDSPNEE